MTIKEIQEQRARLHSQMTALVDKAKAEKRFMTAEENTQFDAIDADITKLGQDLARAQRYEEHQATQNASQQPNMENIDADATQVSPEKVAATKRAFAAYMRFGLEGMSAEDKQVIRGQFVRDADGPQAALTPATGVGGGYLVPTGFSDKIESALKWYGGMMEFADIMDTETGQPIPYPTDNDTGNMGEIVGPNTQVSQAYPSFGNVIFTAYKFSSKLVLVPFELLQDSYFDLDSYLATKLGTRLGRIMNNKFTVGTGSSEPTGLVTAAAAAGLVTQMATGNVATISVDNFTDLEHSVDKAYRTGAKYMLHDQTLKLVKKLKDTQGRSLWLPGLASSLQAGYPDTLNGYPYIINNDMPLPGASNYTVAFGQGSAFKIRRVSGYTVLRLTERYADYGQVGFLCFMRADSNLVDAGTHPIGLLQNSAT